MGKKDPKPPKFRTCGTCGGSGQQITIGPDGKARYVTCRGGCGGTGQIRVG